MKNLMLMVIMLLTIEQTVGQTSSKASDSLIQYKKTNTVLINNSKNNRMKDAVMIKDHPKMVLKKETATDSVVIIKTRKRTNRSSGWKKP